MTSPIIYELNVRTSELTMYYDLALFLEALSHDELNVVDSFYSLNRKEILIVQSEIAKELGYEVKI